MSPSSVSLVVRPRGKPVRQLPDETTVASGASAAGLYHRLAAETGLSIHRLRVTKGSDGSLIPNAKDVTIDRTGLREQSTVYVKDLGPQIAWRTVFIVEYIGPLLIHPLFYLLRPYIYTNPNTLSSFPAPSQLQTLSLILITLHFAKRELETLFVHRFSLATMPARNIFKNSFHYWIFAGVNIAYWIYRPDAATAKPSNPSITYLGLLLYVIGELGNLSTHLTLRGLRSTGGTERGIPQGFGFGLVTCPNYMFETMAWVGIWLVTWSWSTTLPTDQQGLHNALPSGQLRGQLAMNIAPWTHVYGFEACRSALYRTVYGVPPMQVTTFDKYSQGSNPEELQLEPRKALAAGCKGTEPLCTNFIGRFRSWKHFKKKNRGRRVKASMLGS